MKYTFLVLLGFLLVRSSHAQTVVKCKVRFIAEVNDTNYMFSSTEGTLSLNSRTGDLNFSIPLKAIDSDMDTLDNYLETRDESLTFTSTITTSIFDIVNKDENRDTYFPTNGQLFLNNITKGVRGQFSAFKQNNEREELTNNLRMSLVFDIDPTDFNLSKYLPQLKEPVKVEIAESFVNITY